jgi:hypothetical protein
MSRTIGTVVWFVGLSGSTLDRIKRLIGIDIRLYRFARARLIQDRRQIR